MFTLSLSDSKQQRERKCELGAGVYTCRRKNFWINTKIMLAKKATFLEVFYMQYQQVHKQSPDGGWKYHSDILGGSVLLTLEPLTFSTACLASIL